VIRHLVPPVDVDDLVADAVAQVASCAVCSARSPWPIPGFLVTVIER
jgi:hypothetical protein